MQISKRSKLENKINLQTKIIKILLKNLISFHKEIGNIRAVRIYVPRGGRDKAMGKKAL